MPATPTKKMGAPRRARAIKALELRRAGVEYHLIGTQLGISTARAYQDVQDLLGETAREPAEDVRKIELERLDRIQRGHWQAAITGNVKAAELVLKLMDRRAKYLGLDAPAVVDVRGKVAGGLEALLAAAPTEDPDPLTLPGDTHA